MRLKVTGCASSAHGNVGSRVRRPDSRDTAVLGNVDKMPHQHRTQPSALPVVQQVTAHSQVVPSRVAV